jgi:hypothetical protein
MEHPLVIITDALARVEGWLGSVVPAGLGWFVGGLPSAEARGYFRGFEMAKRLIE